MTTIQVLVAREADGEAFRELLPSQYEIQQGSAVCDAALYLVEESLLSKYEDSIRHQIDESAPIFCPVIVVQQPNTLRPSSLSTDSGTESPALVDDILRAPVTRQRLRKRVESLLTRRNQSREVHEQLVERRNHTDQLEFFNSILRHDVLNGMTVINARAEILSDELTGNHREHAETITKWSTNVTEVTGRIQRVLETLTNDERASLEPIDVSTILQTHVEKLETAHADVSFELGVPEAVSVQAGELLSDALWNLLTNAVDHNEGPLTVRTSVDVETERVRIRIADDGRGIDDERKGSIFRRGETGHVKTTGSGFGLFFVDAMVARYGGEVWAEDNADGGATFVVELQRSEESGENI